MRNFSNALDSRFLSDAVNLFIAVELFFDQGTLRYWTGVGNKTINGNTYTGAGTLLNVGGLEESDDLSAPGASVTLSGVDSNLVSTALQEPYQNRECRIHLGSENETFEVFSGFMDTMTIDDSGDTCTINIQCESRLILLDRIVPLRYTQETQERLYPGDTFFSFVTALADRQVTWGRASDTSGGLWSNMALVRTASRG